MLTFLSILCFILMVIVVLLVRQNSKLRDDRITSDTWIIESTGRHMRVEADLSRRLHQAVTVAMREMIQHGETASTLATLELEHAQLQADHAFLWERAVDWDAKLTKEIEMLSSEPVTYWPSTTTASYPAFRPEAWRLNATDDAVEVEFVSPFVD